MCHPQRTETHSRLLTHSMDDVRTFVDRKKTELLACGYRLIEMWECDWACLKQDDPAVASFVADLDLQAPLNSRNAFYGGRTNTIQLYHQAVDDEEIHYDNYMSLYPWVNKYGTYLTGHPSVIYEPRTTDLSPYFGLPKCTVLPPTDLFHPVLPYRHEEKLTFPLCRSCVKENMCKQLMERTTVCEHTDDQLTLTGTWCTPELEEAVRRGYKIINVHEIWHFPTSQTGLCAEYVNTWLKLKEEAKEEACKLYHRRSMYRPHRSLCTQRRHCIKPCQHREEQWATGIGQTDAKLHVG